MGKDYVPLKLNGFDLKIARRLYNVKKVEEASEMAYFTQFPPFSKVIEVEVGSSGTKETIFRLPDQGFIVVRGTIKLPGRTV